MVIACSNASSTSIDQMECSLSISPLIGDDCLCSSSSPDMDSRIAFGSYSSGASANCGASPPEWPRLVASTAAAANASTTAAASGGGVAGDVSVAAAAAVSSLLSPALCCSAFDMSGDSTPVTFRWFVGGDDNDIAT